MFYQPVTSTSLQQITNTRLRNYLILAPFSGECCSHPSPATEHLKSATELLELFPAVMSLHYANHLVLGPYFTGLTAAKLSGSAVIMDTQGSNALFSQQKWWIFLFCECFSGLYQMLVFYLEKDSGPWKRWVFQYWVFWNKLRKCIIQAQSIGQNMQFSFDCLRMCCEKLREVCNISHLFFYFWPKRRRDGPLWPGDRALPFCWWQSFLEETEHRQLVKQLCPFSCSSAETFVQPLKSHTQHQNQQENIHWKGERPAE